MKEITEMINPNKSQAEIDKEAVDRLMQQDKHSLALMVHCQKFELDIVHGKNEKLEAEKKDLEEQLNRTFNSRAEFIREKAILDARVSDLKEELRVFQTVGIGGRTTTPN